MPRWLHTLVGDAGQACAYMAWLCGHAAPLAAMKSKIRFPYVATIVQSCFDKYHPTSLGALSGSPDGCTRLSGMPDKRVHDIAWWPRSASRGLGWPRSASRGLQPQSIHRLAKQGKTIRLANIPVRDPRPNMPRTITNPGTGSLTATHPSTP